MYHMIRFVSILFVSKFHNLGEKYINVLKEAFVLEINENHAISDKLKDLFENDKDAFNKYCKIVLIWYVLVIQDCLMRFFQISV